MANESTPPTSQPTGVLSEHDEKILIDTFACVTTSVLFVTFFIIVTRFRLWHSNWILEKIPRLVDHPVTSLINFVVATMSTASYRNDLYLIWWMVLIIAYDNVLTISAGSTPGSAWLLREYVTLFYVLYLVFFINKENDGNQYYLPLMVLWSFVLAKFSLRLVFHKLVKRAYGVNNSKLVADYMKIEHELSRPNEVIDPITMRGYKYVVVGEGKINAKIEGPEYITEVELPEGVVTVEKVWSCNKRLLDPSIDTDNRLKDVCLSFAFFKLLKRRIFEYPSAESQQEKTRQLVFDGLLSRDDIDSVYRIIRMEIGFLRDLLYTRYPVMFAFGFPVFHLISLMGMLGVSLYISYQAFLRHENPQYDYLRSQRHNVDYTITNILLIMINVMEAFETLSYVFSDWTKVILICQHVRSQMLPHHCFYYKVLALHCKWKFSRSLNNTIGQYSLLKNYKKGYPSWLRIHCLPYSTWGWSPVKVAPRGMNEDKAVPLSPDAKRAIFGSLRLMNGYLTRGVASLQRNGVYDELAWTCALQTEFHTLIVWHIATGLCEIHPVKVGGNKEPIEPHHLVANHLSNYCAYLMVFLPDMLSENIFSVKLFFREILSEMKEFFHEARSYEDKYNLMMQVEHHGNRVIDMGMRLGKYLMQISDDSHRWKIMADFWSEFVIFLAPSGKVRQHLTKLESGGEFITHLWALLYHAGIVDHSTTAYSGYYP